MRPSALPLCTLFPFFHLLPFFRHPICKAKRLRISLNRRALYDGQCPLQGNPMSHGYVDCSSATRRDPRVSFGPTFEPDRDRIARRGLAARFPDERVLRDADRGNVESDSNMARDAEPRGVQAAVSVDQKDVRSSRETGDCGRNSGELAIREIGWNVREARSQLNMDDLERGQISRPKTDRRRVHPVARIRDVHARDPIERREVVVPPDLHR